jgi:hypothetical protein
MHVLAPVDDEEVAGVVGVGDVAGVELAVRLDRLGGCVALFHLL